MKILVTGGAGHIGTNVCLEARVRGHEVVAFDNFVRPLTEENIPHLRRNNVNIVRGDIRNPVDFEKVEDKFGVPDGIIQLAAQCGIPYSLTSPFYDFEVNTLGHLNVLEYARKNGKLPLVFASSNKAYTDMTNTIPMEETDTRYVWKQSNAGWMEGVSPQGIDEGFPIDAFGRYGRSPYGTSKVASDLYCQEYYQAFDVPTVVFRMSCIYGFYQKGVEEQAWVSWFINQIVHGDGKINIFGTGKQVRDMLWAGDVARAYIDALENIDDVKGKAYNIGGGKEFNMSLLEAIKVIEKISGKKSKLTYEEKRHGDQDIWISDISKIMNDLGWHPEVSPKEGMEKMIKTNL